MSDTHPIWCTRAESPDQNHRSRPITAHERGDQVGIEAWLMARPADGFGAGYEYAIIQFTDDGDCRHSYPLEPHQLAMLADACLELDRERTFAAA